MTFSKTCTQCARDLPLSDYHRNKGCRVGADGERRTGDCVTCRSARKRAWVSGNKERAAGISRTFALKKFGLTVEGYEVLLAGQGSVCAICQERCGRNINLSVDHDHESGAVRGLLCSPCNLALGNFRDGPQSIAASLVYLAAHDKALSPEDLADLLRAYPVRRAKRYTLHRKADLTNQ